MTEKVKKGNEKTELPMKRNFSKNANVARIKKNTHSVTINGDENLNEIAKSRYIPPKKDEKTNTGNKKTL